MGIRTIYATIGNSDDKLSQARWAEFAREFVKIIRIQADEIHGVWWSGPDQPWQNCCVGFSVKDEGDRTELLRESLALLRQHYDQDAVAWVRGYPPEMI
jgi:hypothetical protein